MQTIASVQNIVGLTSINSALSSSCRCLCWWCWNCRCKHIFVQVKMFCVFRAGLCLMYTNITLSPRW